MLDLHRIPEYFKVALCHHEALRRLGFLSDDIYIITGPDPFGETMLAVVLKTQDSTFTMSIPAPGLTEETLFSVWPVIVDEWNQGSDESVHAAIWENYAQQLDVMHLIRAMGLRGIMPPTPKTMLETHGETTEIPGPEGWEARRWTNGNIELLRPPHALLFTAERRHVFIRGFVTLDVLRWLLRHVPPKHVKQVDIVTGATYENAQGARREVTNYHPVFPYGGGVGIRWEALGTVPKGCKKWGICSTRGFARWAVRRVK